MLDFGPASASPTHHNALITAAAVPFTGGFTVFVVGSIRNAEAWGCFFNYGTDQTTLRRNNTTARLGTYKGNSGASITEANTGQLYDVNMRIAWRYSAALTEQRLYRNGASVGTAVDSGGTPASQRICVGVNIGGGTFLSGRIAEMIVYPTPLSDANVTSVHTYLVTKYPSIA